MGKGGQFEWYLQNGKLGLVYIGISGRKGMDGNIIHRQNGLK